MEEDNGINKNSPHDVHVMLSDELKDKSPKVEQVLNNNMKHTMNKHKEEYYTYDVVFWNDNIMHLDDFLINALIVSR